MRVSMQTSNRMNTETEARGGERERERGNEKARLVKNSRKSKREADGQGHRDES